jgi:hypothetical protein
MVLWLLILVACSGLMVLGLILHGHRLREWVVMGLIAGMLAGLLLLALLAAVIKAAGEWWQTVRLRRCLYVRRDGTVGICSWCQQERGVRPRRGESHGICLRHKREVLGQIGETSNIQHRTLNAH